MTCTPLYATVRRLDGSARSVKLEDCATLSLTDNPRAVLGLDRLNAQLSAAHGLASSLPDQGTRIAEHSSERTFSLPRRWCDNVPRAIKRDVDGLPFLWATAALDDLKPVFLEIPRDALSEFLDQAGFDAGTKAAWALCQKKTVKRPRDQGLRARCLEHILEAFRSHDRYPSHAIWRRPKLVPFSVSIPEHEKIMNFPTLLKAEYDGILARCVRGCLDWQTNGLGVPDEVNDATRCYRAEQDLLGEFIAEEMTVEPSLRCKASDAYQRYRTRTQQSGEELMSLKRFGLAMAERGFLKKENHGIWYLGIGLRSETVPDRPY